jgi:dihydroorotate dehydrogenase (NAD+) catalytic subunit
MIELAPTSKRGLGLSGPVILAAGYGSELEAELVSCADALVTLPVSLRPHAARRDATRVLGVPGGCLYERGGANPGLAAVIHAQRHFWRRLKIPVILSLGYEDAGHWGEIAMRASRIDVIAALEIETVDESDVKQLVAQVKGRTDLPVIVKIALARALEQAESAVEGGADALTVGMGPRGTCIVEGRFWEGRLEGPVIKPLALSAVIELAENGPQIPLIAAGGVQSAADIQDFLDAGASAVQISSSIWRGRRGLMGLKDAAFYGTAPPLRHAPALP